MIQSKPKRARPIQSPSVWLDHLRAVARQLGLECLDTAWLGVNGYHHFRCALGHEYTNTAESVLYRGKVLCPPCRDLARMARIHAAAKQQGGECLDTQFLGPQGYYRFVCAEGHQWTALARFLLATGSWCKVCSMAEYKNRPRVERAIDRPADLYGIQRIRPKRRPAGWRVAIARDGQFVAWKIFSDIGYGGEQAAFIAAQAYRDTMVKQHPPIRMRDMRTRLRKHNTSGYPGVTLQMRAGKPSAFLARTQTGPGKSLARSFSINTYGWDNALRLALEARQQQLLQVEDKPVCRSSAAIVVYEQ